MVVPLGHPTWIALVVGCRLVPGHSGVIKWSVAVEFAAASAIRGAANAPSPQPVTFVTNDTRLLFAFYTVLKCVARTIEFGLLLFLHLFYYAQSY